MSGDSLDLTGVWYGRYDASTSSETNAFIAHLEQDGDALSGVITEPDQSGQANIRRAFVSGRRASHAIEFTKQYDGGVLAHAVRYWGLVNDEGTEITGRWIIVRHAGTFVMSREKFRAEELEEEREEELTVR
jgi:hypothetical protein